MEGNLLCLSEYNARGARTQAVASPRPRPACHLSRDSWMLRYLAGVWRARGQAMLHGKRACSIAVD